MDVQDLAHFVEWREGMYVTFPSLRNLNLSDYLTANVNVSQATAVSELLMPKLVEQRGCVVLAGRSDPAYLDQWAEATDGTSRSIELAVNLVQLWDVFDWADDDAGALRAMEQLAERMRWLWPLWAQRQFPDRRFEAHANDVYGPGVTLCTVSCA